MKANEIRKDIIRMIKDMGEGHPGGSLSCVEILISLYDEVLTDDDIFIMSKGHACQALYTVLQAKGKNPKLSGHPDIEQNQGIYCTTGSLGHGLPVAVGTALAKKLKGEPGRVYVLMSDGELQEGTTWESIMIAFHHKLDNLFMIIDYNKIQALDRVRNILTLGGRNSIIRKLESFGLLVVPLDGHDSDYISDVLLNYTYPEDLPVVILAETIKGKGVSFMENDPKWHARVLDKHEYQRAMAELS